MEIRGYKPLKIALGIRDILLAVFALATLVLTFAYLDERHTSSVGNETASMAESTHLVPVDSMDSEMKMDIERAVVLERVKDIYRVVRNEYINHGGYCESEWLFDRVFCTQSLNELLMSVHCKEEDTGTLFFEIDRWSMLRYPEAYVSFEEFEVKDLWINGNKKRASVSFVVYDDDSYTPVRIDLVYENNRWLIDDFHNLRYMLDLRNCMWNYLLHDIV